MKEKTIERLLYIVGVIALIGGAIDPLEGSVIIAGGSALLAVTTWLLRDPHRKIFLWCFVAIAVGVAFMFYLSSKGEFGGVSGLSWWYGLLVVPYPLGWVVTIVLLIIRGLAKRGKRSAISNQQ